MWIASLALAMTALMWIASLALAMTVRTVSGSDRHFHLTIVDREIRAIRLHGKPAIQISNSLDSRRL